MTQVVVGYLHPGQVDHHFVQCLDDMVLHEADHGDRLLWPPIRLQSNYDLHTSRNELTAAFLDRTPGDHLLFIDTDMGFAPDSLSRLLEVCDEEHPVVGGLCFTHKRTTVTTEGAQRFTVFPTIYRYTERDDAAGFQAAYDYPSDELIEVGGTGAAFLLIRRDLLEQMRDQHGDRWFDPVQHPVKGTRFSEDLSFCVRVWGTGHQVHVHTGVKTSHRKSVWLDESLFRQQQEGA
jgi:hypothetical protein